MEVELGNYLVNLEIEKKNNKNIYFRFKDDNTLYVTCHHLVSKKEVLRLIKQNEKSLLKMYEKFLQHADNNKGFNYLGESYVIVYDENIKHLTIEDNMIYVKNEKELNKWLKNECERIFKERINLILNNFTDIPPFSLRIRKMKTRWGVNNVTKRIITLNSELIKKDITLIDYVIIHELCHFYEANHSQRFWREVEKRYPYYKLARKRLRVE